MHWSALRTAGHAQKRSPPFGAEPDITGDRLTDLVGPFQPTGHSEPQIASETILTSGKAPHRIEAGVEKAEARKIGDIRYVVGAVLDGTRVGSDIVNSTDVGGDIFNSDVFV
jgi:hypothetical protein